MRHVLPSLLVCCLVSQHHLTQATPSASPPTHPSTGKTPSPPLLPSRTTPSTSWASTTGNNILDNVNHIPNQLALNATWQHALQNFLAGIAHRAKLPSATGDNSHQAQLVTGLLSELPGLMRGLGGLDVGQDDVGEVLAGLFADPRAVGTPAWIESLTQGGTPALSDDIQTLLQTLSSQAPEGQIQALLDQVFSNVSSGLQSLNLGANSSLEDVVSAVMNNTGLLSSLSTDALQMLAALAGVPDQFPDLLAEASPMNTESKCAADLQTWASGLQRGDLWAIQMLDAMGKLEAGILTGQLTLEGDYVECTEASFSNQTYSLEAHMCPMAFATPSALAPYVMDRPMVFHLCVPKSCSEAQLYGLLQPTLDALGSYHLGIVCVGPRNPEGDSRFIGITTMLAVLALLCAAGTAYGIILDRRACQAKQSKMHPMKPNGFTNQTYAINGEAPLVNNHANGNLFNGNKPNIPNGNHVNSGLTNGEAPKMADLGQVNGGLTNGEAPNMLNGGHVNGGVTNGDVPNMPNGGHVNGGPTNGDAPNMVDGGHVNGGLPGSYVQHREDEEKKVDLADAEGGVVKTENGGGPVDVVNGPTSVSKPSAGGSSRPDAQLNLGSQVLLGFSVLRNGRKLLSCQKNQSDITCLHGIRVLSMCWVVLGHAYSMLDFTTGNSISKNLEVENFSFMVIPAGVLAVDTFFLLSGCLSAFLFLRSTKKSGLTCSGIVLYYIHRVWRLTPLYAVLLGVYVAIFPYLKVGPYQTYLGMDSEATNCRNYWHYNLLYINNLAKEFTDKMCFGWSWYLSNDMQFSFLAPLVIIPWTFTGSRKRLNILGFALCAAMVLTHCISSGVISYTEDLSMAGANGTEYMEKIYFPPWTRIGPYAVGLLLGYILFVTPPKYTMDKLSVFLGWFVATAVALTVVYVRYDNVGDLMTKGATWNASQSAAFEALDKVVWAGCVAWVVFACSKGYGGFVNTLLSWSAWMPLSRLAYGVYLVHCVVFFVIGGNLRRLLYMDSWTMTILFLAVTVISFLVSFIFAMLVEAPMLGLEKAVLGKIFRTKK